MGGYLEPFRKWRMRRIRADLGSTAVFHDTTTFYPTTVISNAIRVRDNISIAFVDARNFKSVAVLKVTHARAGLRHIIVRAGSVLGAPHGHKTLDRLG